MIKLFIITFLCCLSIYIMFATEKKSIKWWLRLPIINLVLYAFLFILGIIEEIYLTFNPEKRTTYIKSSIFQKYF